MGEIVGRVIEEVVIGPVQGKMGPLLGLTLTVKNADDGVDYDDGVDVADSPESDAVALIAGDDVKKEDDPRRPEQTDDKKADVQPLVFEFNLEKFNRALAFQVARQDERFNARFDFDAGNGVRIRMENVPELSETNGAYSVYIRGSEKGRDLSISTRYFQTNDERDEAYSKVMWALTEWSHKFWPEILRKAVR